MSINSNSRLLALVDALSAETLDDNQQNAELRSNLLYQDQAKAVVGSSIIGGRQHPVISNGEMGMIWSRKPVAVKF